MNAASPHQELALFSVFADPSGGLMTVCTGCIPVHLYAMAGALADYLIRQEGVRQSNGGGFLAVEEWNSEQGLVQLLAMDDKAYLVQAMVFELGTSIRAIYWRESFRASDLSGFLEGVGGSARCLAPTVDTTSEQEHDGAGPHPK
ncbi:hypothetical protein BU16DRAFT_619761 [Lophium mytilinum]|uniref:Uncharacterized protein n=1 Tax=Lophium mytilinum TaxID=390894 RepID=A0A6A6QMD7_9PEZI|nr:hypothetical protein BU16DRAFT_619761 [Lophium mytilinum]